VESRVGLFLFFVSLCFACTAPVGASEDEPDEDPVVDDRLRISVDLEELDGSEELLNPERGFYTGVDLLAPDAVSIREQGHSLAIALVRLDDYRYGPLPADLLERLDDGFAAVRSAGIKVILRFMYNAAFTDDAPKEQILAHIAQLEPLLRANGDVIAVMQAGFIGAWGEWHGSQNGLDNDADRGEILDALLDALPAERAVQVRTPMYKRALYGEALADEEAHSGSRRARVGHHNDCFLASDDDFGTYAAPIDEWRGYLVAESRYLPIGGETCSINAPRTDCEAALAELSDLHFSYLNRDYKREVIDGWSAQGCGAEIRARLGYRLAALHISHTEAVTPGDELALELTIANRGFAALFNARPVYATLVGDDGERVAVELEGVDSRRWLGGETATISARLAIPDDLEPGEYQLGLWLPDADPRLAADPRYAVQLANAGAWDEATGDNLLSKVFVVAP
jgi:hypothetical protein